MRLLRGPPLFLVVPLLLVLLGPQQQNAAAAAPAPQAFPWLNSAVAGLSPGCKEALAGIEAQLAAGDFKATMATMEVKVASGHVVEALVAMGQGIRMMQTDPLTNAETAHYALGYSWTSMGNPDGCRAIASETPFHSCLVDAQGPFLRLGLCAPRACTGNDVALGLAETLRRVMPPLPPDDPIVRALHAKTDCGDDRGFPWTAGAWAVVAAFCTLAALVAAGSAVDLLEWRRVRQQQEQQGAGADKGQSLGTTVVVAAAEAQGGAVAVEGKGWRRHWKDVLLCFSLPRNWAKLTAPGRAAAAAATTPGTAAVAAPSSTPDAAEGGRTAALDGIRALSMCWVVFGHTYIFGDLVIGFANHTPDVVGTLLPLTPDGAPQPGHATPVNPGFMGTWGGQAVNAYLAVDTFLFLSGLLAVRGLLLRRRTTAAATSLPAAAGASLKQAPLIYALRWLRLTPAYAIALFFYWLLLGVVGGKGPVWRAAFKSEYDICERTWYANFLYLNNFITGTNGVTGARGYSCMPVSWYLAVDFQLFLLAPPVAFLAAARPRLALLLLGLGAAASAAYTAWAGTVQGWNFAMVGGGEGFNRYFVRFYTKPWTRAVPSLVGMGLAVLLFHHAPTAGKDDRGRRALVAWALGFALIALAAEGARGAYTTVPSLWTPLRYSLYLSLSRVAWGLGLALLTHRLFLGEGGPVRHLLESHALAVVSRLTYCMYLCHPSVIFWLYAQQPNPVHFTRIYLTVTFLGVLALTTLCAAAVNLAVEQPAANLLRLLMAGGGGGRRRSKESKDDACPPPVDWRRSQRRRSVTMTEDGDEGEEEERKAAQDGGMVELEMAVRAPGAAKYEV